MSKTSNSWLEKALAGAGMSSLGELADVTGINKGTLSKYFNGKQVPSVAVIPRLCSALNVSPESLLIGLGVVPEGPPRGGGEPSAH